MALARSASGPGGLSINTNSANSLFGSSTATTPAAGMFGSTQPATGGGLFGNAAKTSAPATGGLFGSTTSGTGGLFGSAPATSQPQTGGLFGSTATSQPQTGGLFGSTTTSAPATAGLFGSTTPAAGGLFGSTPATSQPQTGGLFGSTATSQPQTGGLFGSTTTNQPQQTSSLFGAQPAQNSNAVTGGGLFGNTQNQNKPATSTLFGNLGGAQNQQTQQPQQQQSTLFGGLGQSQQQQQSGNMFSNTLPSLGQTNRNQTVPGVRIDMSNIRSTTRFNDLHESLQKDIENMDNIIQAQIQLKNECDAIMPAHGQQLAAVVPSVEYVQRKSAGVDDALEIDAQAIAQVRNLVKTDAEAAKLSFRVIDNLKLPPQYHNNGIWSGKQTNADSRATNNDEEAQDLVGFFSKTADELSATLEKYQKNITEIELHLRGVEATSGQQLSAMIARRNGSSSGQENPIQELAETLTAFEQSILGVAGKVGETREGVQKLQLGDFLTGPGNVKTNGKRGGVY